MASPKTADNDQIQCGHAQWFCFQNWIRYLWDTFFTQQIFFLIIKLINFRGGPIGISVYTATPAVQCSNLLSLTHILKPLTVQRTRCFCDVSSTKRMTTFELDVSFKCFGQQSIQTSRLTWVVRACIGPMVTKGCQINVSGCELVGIALVLHSSVVCTKDVVAHVHVWCSTTGDVFRLLKA